MTFASVPAFAHHPAADIVDPEIYEMIDANVANTPHADLVLDDMGSDMDSVDAATEAVEEIGSMASEDNRPITVTATDAVIEIEDAVDTISLYGDVTSALAE
ncbi:MAG: hypothetical protein OQK32_02675 [Gammaproteobacteria bacterium]|nr:hypothetical protein [Gammaproteobacteria bacterium]MCW8922755.1 hypothetical protein [Gammaproteobacteria bacterium]